jgi:hypothetical protein
MQRYIFALAAIVAGCGGGASTSVTTSSVPPTGGGGSNDAGMPVGGGGGTTGGVDGGAGGGGGGGGGGAGGGGGTACTATKPELLPRFVAPDGRTVAAYSVAVDDRSVYVSGRTGNSDSDLVPGQSFVYRTDKAPGGTATMLWQSNSDGPGRILADGNWLFLVGGNGELVVRLDKDGANATTLAARTSSALPSSSLLAGGQIYFTISPPGSVDRIAETGGAVSEVASAQGAYSVAVDDSWIYFASSGGFYRVARSGGTPETILGGASSFFAGIAVDATHLYYGDGYGTVYAADKTPGASTRAIAQVGQQIDGLFSDGARLYVATDAAMPGPWNPSDEVIAMDGDGGNQRLLTPSSYGRLTAMVTDDTYIYFAYCAVWRACK